MAKRKKTNWDHVKWTYFEVCDTSHYPESSRPHVVMRNSIYQVSIWYARHEAYGEYAHLSIKTHDRQARHDWRELQRIKNELFHEEAWAIEMYPPESVVVDTSNQYHLYVFNSYRFDGLGFTERLVTEAETHNTKQRPFRPEFRPPDLVPLEEMQRRMEEHLKEGKS